VEYLIICAVSGVWAGLIGRGKGSSTMIWFAIGAVVPFLGVLIAALYRHETDELRRQCPTCGKVVPLHDQICTRCGTELDFPDVAIEPESAAAPR
jgi:predicted nucleic acid-binding Zn ribbon protein